MCKLAGVDFSKGEITEGSGGGRPGSRYPLRNARVALVGVPGTGRTTYEGQAAVELELVAKSPTNRGYPFRLRPEGAGWVVEVTRSGPTCVLATESDVRYMIRVVAVTFVDQCFTCSFWG